MFFKTRKIIRKKEVEENWMSNRQIIQKTEPYKMAIFDVYKSYIIKSFLHS